MRNPAEGAMPMLMKTKNRKGIDQHAAAGENNNCLPNAIQNWATATTGDMRQHHMNRTKRDGDQSCLADQGMQFPSSPPGATTTGLGLLLSVWTPPSHPRLNPRMQWWLMGMPYQLLTCSGSAETAASCWLEQSRSAYSWIVRELEM